MIKVFGDKNVILHIRDKGGAFWYAELEFADGSGQVLPNTDSLDPAQTKIAALRELCILVGVDIQEDIRQ